MLANTRGGGSAGTSCDQLDYPLVVLAVVRLLFRMFSRKHASKGSTFLLTGFLHVADHSASNVI